MFTLLGATEENPEVEINGNKISLIYDVPHIFKSIQNNLILGDILIDKKLFLFKILKKLMILTTKVQVLELCQKLLWLIYTLIHSKKKCL